MFGIIDNIFCTLSVYFCVFLSNIEKALVSPEKKENGVITTTCIIGKCFYFLQHYPNSS